MDNRDGKSTEHIIGHELNHFAQEMEGFSTGGNELSTLFYALNSTGYDKNRDGEIQKYLLNVDRNGISENDSKILDNALKIYDAFDKKDRKSLLNYYDRIEGEIDSRAVELAITLKSKFGNTNVTYEQLKNEVLKRDGIDENEVIYLYFKGFPYDSARGVDFMVVSENKTQNALSNIGIGITNNGFINKQTGEV
jgi:DNA-binding ferritin-like protein (Dps family)